MTRDTVGKISSELLQKTPESRDPIELMREQLTDFEQNVYDCAERHKKIFHGNFYIIVITKKERLMQNVIRNYFFARQTCPTPEWDQIVYQFHRPTDTVRFMWVIPSKDTCQLLKENALIVDPEERKLLNYVLQFEDGSLLKTSKHLNGEEATSPFLA